jgi:GT2 family glycosyltransferase
MRLSVVVPVRNGAQTISAQMEALLAQSPGDDWELIVVDNASTDGTAELVDGLASGDPRVVFVSATKGRGAGYARNVGVDLARASSIAFCDADDVVGCDWVEAMAHALSEHAFVTGPIDVDVLNDDETIAARGRWLARNELALFGGSIPFASSCNMGVRREAIQAVGGFDERFLTGQDIELSLRLCAAGYSLQWSPDAKIHYRYRPTSAGLARQAWRYGRVHPMLEARAQDLGIADRGPRFPARQLLWLVMHAPNAARSHARGRWIWTLAHTAGRAAGWARCTLLRSDAPTAKETGTMANVC